MITRDQVKNKMDLYLTLKLRLLSLTLSLWRRLRGFHKDAKSKLWLSLFLNELNFCKDLNMKSVKFSHLK